MSIDELTEIKVKTRKNYFFDKQTLFRIVNVYLAHNTHCITDREYKKLLKEIKKKYGWSNLLSNYLSQENFKN